MRKLSFFIILLFPVLLTAQNKAAKDSLVFKKRVLETAEIDLLTSFYTQNGHNAAVTGGIGTESLQDYAGNISISIPLNADDILSIDGTISAYTSASSSNLNPFSGASNGEEEDEDEDDDDKNISEGTSITGSPWVASTGASKSDVWLSGVLGYSHSSDNRNNVFNTHLSFANEFDYTSIGGGLGYSHQFNRKNSEISLSADAYIDQWRPAYPTEIKTYIYTNGNLNADFFNNVPIYNQNGIAIDKNANDAWQPTQNVLVNNKGRNTFSASLSFSQILNRNAQISLFLNPTYQNGWLANPMQRVYFSDRDNFYIGIVSDIANYTNPSNKGVFQLADDIERLPESRLKIPVGMRLHYFISENLTLRTYYRYYYDDWGIQSHTAEMALPIKLSDKFTFYPSFRYYEQTQADYFAPYEQHISTDDFYTSDYDLSAFTTYQYGFGIKYTDIFTKSHLAMLGLKNISFNYAYYYRNTGLKSHIVSLGTSFVLDH